MTAVRSAVLGGVDGVITSFTIVAASDVGGLGTRAVAVVGFASLLADATSMGASEFLSVSAERAATADVSLSLSSRVSDARRLVPPVRAGVVCFASFVVWGCVPIVLYLATTRLLACAVLSLVELMLLGAARARLSGEPLLLGLGQTALLGAAAGAVAYGVASAT